MDGGDGWGGGGGILEFNLFSPPINSNDFGDPHKYTTGTYLLHVNSLLKGPLLSSKYLVAIDSTVHWTDYPHQKRISNTQTGQIGEMSRA